MGRFQIFALIGSELVVLLIVFFGMPYKAKVENAVRLMFYSVRLLCMACLVSFENFYQVSQITKARVAIFVISLECCFTVFLLAYMLIGLVNFCLAGLGLKENCDNLTPLDLPHNRRKTFGCEYTRDDLKTNLNMPIATTVFPSPSYAPSNNNTSVPLNQMPAHRFSDQSSNGTIVEEETKLIRVTSPHSHPMDACSDDTEPSDLYRPDCRKAYAQSQYLSYYGESRQSSLFEGSVYGSSENTVLERPTGLFNDMRSYKPSQHKWV